jgi:hypothetical protein
VPHGVIIYNAKAHKSQGLIFAVVPQIANRIVKREITASANDTHSRSEVQVRSAAHSVLGLLLRCSNLAASFFRNASQKNRRFDQVTLQSTFASALQATIYARIRHVYGEEASCVIVIGDPRVSDVGYDAIWETTCNGCTLFILIDTLTKRPFRSVCWSRNRDTRWTRAEIIIQGHNKLNCNGRQRASEEGRQQMILFSCAIRWENSVSFGSFSFYDSYALSVAWLSFFEQALEVEVEVQRWSQCMLTDIHLCSELWNIYETSRSWSSWATARARANSRWNGRAKGEFCVLQEAASLASVSETDSIFNVNNISDSFRAFYDIHLLSCLYRR